MAKLFANSGDPDQMSHSAASDLGLHCASSHFGGLETNLGWAYAEKKKLLEVAVKGFQEVSMYMYMGVVGWCEGVMYLVSPGRPTDIGLVGQGLLSLK